MTKEPHTESAVPRVLRRYFIIAALYSLLIFILPASGQTMRNHNLTAEQYHVLLFAAAIPSMLTWLAAFIGYARLHDYAQALREAPEAPSFQRLATGVTWLAWSLPIALTLALILSSISYRHTHFTAAAIIINNFVALIMPLVGLIIIGSAARSLTATAQLTFSLLKARAIIVLFSIAGLAYCYFTFKHFDISNLNSTANPYYLPIWAMLLTIVIPYLYAWFTGILASYEILLFRKNIRGVLYRQALQLLVGGLVIVIACSIALQYITSASPRVTYLILNAKFAFVLLFRIVTGLGFVLVAMGANKLKRIEEV